jgi:hypothetical protein
VTHLHEARQEGVDGAPKASSQLLGSCSWQCGLVVVAVARRRDGGGAAMWVLRVEWFWVCLGA